MTSLEPSEQPERSEQSAPDYGLLTPGTAGTAVEAATGDDAVLRALVDAEAALARAQGAPAAAAEAIAAAAGRLDVRDLALAARAGGNPVIPLAERLRTAVGEDAARYVHRGATSQDIVDTALMLVASRALVPLLADLGRAAGALTEPAREHAHTVMPGRTLTQHAVPTTFGLKAAGWRSLVLDARDRLGALRLPAQLGGAAGTLAALRPAGPGDAGAHGGLTDRDPGVALLGSFARETGLAEPDLPWHTLRTPVVDLGAALAFTCGALGKIAADVLLLARTETAEVAEGSGGGSSAMPHKANPVHSTLIAAAARQAPALASVLFGSLTAEDERPAGAWHAEWEPLRQLLRLAGGAAWHAAELAGGLRVFPARMAEHLGLTGGLIVSERVSAELGRAPAKDLVARAAAEGVPFTEVLRAAGHEDLADPAGWTGSAAALVERALRRT